MFIHLWHSLRLLAGCTLAVVWLANLESDGMVLLPWLVYHMVGACVAVSIGLATKLRACSTHLSCVHLSIPAMYQYSTSMAHFHKFDQTMKKS